MGVPRVLISRPDDSRGDERLPSSGGASNVECAPAGGVTAMIDFPGEVNDRVACRRTEASEHARGGGTEQRWV